MFRPTPPPDSWTNHGHGFIFRHARQTNSMNRGRTMHWSARQTNLKQWCPPRPARPIHKELWKIQWLAPSKHSNSMNVFLSIPPRHTHFKKHMFFPPRTARPISWKVELSTPPRQTYFMKGLLYRGVKTDWSSCFWGVETDTLPTRIWNLEPTIYDIPRKWWTRLEANTTLTM